MPNYQGAKDLLTKKTERLYSYFLSRLRESPDLKNLDDNKSIALYADFFICYAFARGEGSSTEAAMEWAFDSSSKLLIERR